MTGLQRLSGLWLVGLVGCLEPPVPGTDPGLAPEGGSVAATGGGQFDGTGGSSLGTGGLGPSDPGTGGLSTGGVDTGGSMASGGSPEGATGGALGTGGDPVTVPGPLQCSIPGPDGFTPNPAVGGGGLVFSDSEHFRVYGFASDVEGTLRHLEAAHQCFVEQWCLRSPGLSVHDGDAGPYSLFNVYSVATLGGAGGVMRYDAVAGLSYLEVLSWALPDPRVTVHEFGHALTLSEYGWVDQTRTGAWWETVANWVADTYLTSDHCAEARAAFGVETGASLIDLDTVIGESHQMLVSDQNLYEAWPFFTYLTENPDGYLGLGRNVMLELFRQHPRNNDTPLHVLADLTAPVPVQRIIGRYWARMAYLDIGHELAQQAFFAERSGLDYDNLDSVGGSTYRVKADRRPAYGGANLIPLQGTGLVQVQVTNLGNGLAESDFTATLVVREVNGTVHYEELVNGAGAVDVPLFGEATLVVANTPTTLYQYDAFSSALGSPELTGLNYEVLIEGAVPAP